MNDIFTITLLFGVISSIFVCVGAFAASKALLYFISRY